MVALALTAGLFAFGGETSQVLLHRGRFGQPAVAQQNAGGSAERLIHRGVGRKGGDQGPGPWLAPEWGEADLIYASGRRQTIPLARSAEDGGLYAGGVEAVQEPFDYRVRLYDGTSDIFPCHVWKLGPSCWRCPVCRLTRNIPGLGEVVRKPTDLALLAGSQLRIHVTANKPLGRNGSAAAGNLVQMIAKEGAPAIPVIPLALEGTDGKQLTAELPLTENLAGFSVHLTDDHGLESKNAPFYAA